MGQYTDNPNHTFHFDTLQLHCQSSLIRKTICGVPIYQTTSVA